MLFQTSLLDYNRNKKFVAVLILVKILQGHWKAFKVIEIIQCHLFDYIWPFWSCCPYNHSPLTGGVNCQMSRCCFYGCMGTVIFIKSVAFFKIFVFFFVNLNFCKQYHYIVMYIKFVFFLWYCLKTKNCGSNADAPLLEIVIRTCSRSKQATTRSWSDFALTLSASFCSLARFLFLMWVSYFSDSCDFSMVEAYLYELQTSHWSLRGWWNPKLNSVLKSLLYPCIETGFSFLVLQSL